MSISKTKIISGFPSALALVAITQLPFWLMQQVVSIHRPLINLDMIVAVLILSWRCGLGVIALCFAWLVEINHDAAASYHFVDLADFIDSARFFDLVKLSHILSWKLSLVLALFALCAAAAVQIAGRWRPGYDSVLLFILLSVLVDSLNGSNHVLGMERDRPFLTANIAGSPGLSTVKMIVVNRRRGAEPMERLPDPHAYRQVLDWHARHPQDTVLLVLVESMGLPEDPAVRAWFQARLATPMVKQRWNVESTDEPFHGPTIYGEMRVLCGLHGHYSRLTPAAESGCLPALFVADGNHAYGLHGFNMRMFDRQRWWPQIGLEPQDFSMESRSPANMNCNDAFPGVCDAVVLRKAIRLAEEPRRFVYAVTLDTHLPLPAKDITVPPELEVLCSHAELTSTACQMTARLAAVLDELARDLSQMHATPLVVVSGDHSPPFLDESTRNVFDSARVPTFMLQAR